LHSSNPYKPVIAVVLSRFPYPLEKGDKLRAYYQLLDLCKVFDVHLICTTEKEIRPEDLEKIAALCKAVHIFKLKKINLFLNLCWALFDSKPFQVRYFHQKWIQRKIDQILKDIKPTHIYCQLIRASEYVKNYHACLKTIDYMDALSKGMERRTEQVWGIKKWIFSSEYKRLAKYERSIFDYFENHTIISKQDRNYIMHPQREQITLVPNGVDNQFFETFAIERNFDLVFTGNMGYPPNIDAALFIEKEIIPELKALNLSLKCLISGANPHPSLTAISKENFKVNGWVEDIRESYLSARIFIAPMMIGTGLQNKLLEAMAMGLPCITSALANNALLAESEKEILIANDAKTFAVQINRLIKDPVLYKKISEAGQKFVKENYQWSSANSVLISKILGN
jgi:glycosyltransferase involved in cell wall biosynthesis